MKQKRLFFMIAGLCLLLAAPGCGPRDIQGAENEGKSAAPPQELLVSAAASLQEVLSAVEKEYRREYPDLHLVFNFGSSGTLQRQIEQGAPVDVFISAGVRQMDELERQGLLLPGTREDLLRNQLVLVTGVDHQGVSGLPDLATGAVERIAIGTPETVPAGQYARQALQALGLWDMLQPKLVLAKDVKQVLTYVETGNAEAGFVYYSDAVGSEGVKIIETLSPDLHEPILYPAAVVKESGNRAAAEAFLEYLKGENARRIFEEYGFITVQRGN